MAELHTGELENEVNWYEEIQKAIEPLKKRIEYLENRLNN
jgi:hypothetical protein